MNEKLINKLFACEAIESLVLGGSRATDNQDDKSDFDYYVYLCGELSETKRREILSEFVSYMEYSNDFWELEDDGTLINGIDIEFIYRTIEQMDSSIENVLVKGHVSNGYSTCFVDNVLKSKVIFDKSGRYEALKVKCKELLTKEVFDKVIHANFPILMDKMPSLYYQVEKAMMRNDIISINHRSSAYFEMYFDIVFALNRQTHPGEKRMLEMALKLDMYPVSMEKDIKDYFDNLFVDNEKSLMILKKISEELFILLSRKGYRLTINSYKKKR